VRSSYARLRSRARFARRARAVLPAAALGALCACLLGSSGDTGPAAAPTRGETQASATPAPAAPTPAAVPTPAPADPPPKRAEERPAPQPVRQAQRTEPAPPARAPAPVPARTERAKPTTKPAPAAPPRAPAAPARATPADTANAPVNAPASEPKRAATGDQLIADVQKRYERVRDLRASFEQEANVASLGRTDLSSGTVTVKRPGRMRWEYAKPEARVLTIDGETVKMYTPGEKQLQIAPLSPESFSPTALSFLLGDGDLRESFTAEVIPAGERKDAAERNEVGLRLKPKSDASFEHLELWLGAVDLALRESVVVDLFGNRTTVRFRELVENTGVPEATFQVEVPSGTDVIDLRSGGSR
jgi:outer membrane lipoprotein carrier protein